MARTCLSFCSNRMPGGIGFVTEPFGPLTTTWSGLISTFTFSGTGMGFLPILAISLALSIDAAEQLAAKTLPARLLAGHDTVRRRQNVDAQTAQHLRDLCFRNIDAAARTTDAFDIRYHFFTFGPVFEENGQRQLSGFFGRLEMRDVTLFLQNSRNLNFQS